ncbi:hypothetical protein T06_2672 [Trichinella sp. T6]|nr:hypothetical protein T06_2672 [Trichinella sp. T6]
MKRADAVLNQVCSLPINYHKAQTNVELFAMLQGKTICITMPYYAVIGSTSDAEEEDKEFDNCSVHVSTVISHVSRLNSSALWFSSLLHNGLCQGSGTIYMNLNIFL